MLIIPPGNEFFFESETTGQMGLQNFDSPPTVTFWHGGVVDSSVVVTFTNIGTGKYLGSGSIPIGYLPFSVCWVEVTGFIDGLLISYTVDIQVSRIPPQVVNGGYLGNNSSVFNQGAAVANRLLFDINQRGRTVTYQGVDYLAIIKKASSGDVEYVSAISGRNMANSDVRRLILSPLSFPSGGPVEGSVFNWYEDGTEFSWKVVSKDVTMMTDTPIELRLWVYRVPQASTVSTAPVGETNPGQRISYQVPNIG